MVIEREFWSTSLEAGYDCPSTEDLVRAANDTESVVSAHVARCGRCRKELMLFREYAEGDLRADERDHVEWISRRLINPAATSRRTLLGFLRALVPNRTAIAFAGSAAVLILVAGIAIDLPDSEPAPVTPSGEAVQRAASIDLISPRGDVNDIPAHFEWGSVTGAHLYRVRLLEVDGQVMWTSTSAGSACPLPSSLRGQLPRGKRVIWEVQALDGGGNVLATGRQDFRKQVR